MAPGRLRPRPGGLTIARGARVLILQDATSYTDGCYTRCQGDVIRIEHVPLRHRRRLTLCLVRVDWIPWDEYGCGCWWYRPEELAVLRPVASA